jgi:DNA polymerase-1
LLNEIRNPSCELCPLGASSEKVCVMGRGEKSPIVFVGDYFNSHDIKAEEAVSGLGGHVLNVSLQKLGYDISNMYITNAVKCHTDKPKATNIKACREYLIKEIEAIKPKVIVTLGATALESVLKLKGVSKLRGQYIWSEEFQCFVVPTFHPNSFGYNPEQQPLFVEDLKLALSKAYGTGEEKAKNKNYFVVKTIEEFRSTKKFLLSKELLAVDTETFLSDPIEGEILCVPISWAEGYSVLIPLCGQHMVPIWTPEEEKEIRAGLEEILYTVKLVFHNGKYDVQFLICAGFDMEKLFNSWVGDTMLLDHLLDENSKHGLDDLALKFTDLGAYYVKLDELKNVLLKEMNKGRTKKIKKDDFTYDMFPTEVLWEYANYDSDATLRSNRALTDILEKYPKLKIVYEYSTMPLAKLLTKMELRGLNIDRERLDTNIAKLETKLKEVEDSLYSNEYVIKAEEFFAKRGEAELKEHYDSLKTKRLDWDEYRAKHFDRSDYKFNFSSTKQLQVLLFDVLNLEPIENKKTGNPTTDRNALEIYAEKHPFCSQFNEYRNLQQFLSTFLIGARDRLGKDGRLRTSFLQHGTVTGRLSSRNPNFQNIPKHKKGDVDPTLVRECYIASEDHYLVEADFSQLEFRLFADVSKDPLLISDIANGLDIHRKVASIVYKCTEAEVEKEQRSKTKNTVFGLLYGEGIWGLSKRLKMTEEEAQTISDTFFGMYPDAFKCIENYRDFAKKNGYTENLFGRRRRFPILLGGYREEIKREWNEALRQAFNFVIQGTAGDLTAFAMLRLDKAVKERGIEAHMLIQIHDAIVFEVRKDHLNRLCSLIKEEMPKQVAGIVCPLGCEIEYGERWSELKHWEESPLYWFYHPESDCYFTRPRDEQHEYSDIDSKLCVEIGIATTPDDENEAIRLHNALKDKYESKGISLEEK